MNLVNCTLQAETTQVERQSQSRKACSELGYGTPTEKQQLKGLKTLIVYEPHKALICLMAKVLRSYGLNITSNHRYIQLELKSMRDLSPS